jgi:hypothetical protein
MDSISGAPGVSGITPTRPLRPISAVQSNRSGYSAAEQPDTSLGRDAVQKIQPRPQDGAGRRLDETI